ncbi:hypothetical protein B0T09DRAFT_114814 [Sordaria sp. MPI-SDFR-AT-0083]|nr:hypothetical protein B0T09DRAFT_114814 [Sordaria sp. MPI-SDFR-AT-0083]
MKQERRRGEGTRGSWLETCVVGISLFVPLTANEETNGNHKAARPANTLSPGGRGGEGPERGGGAQQDSATTTPSNALYCLLILAPKINGKARQPSEMICNREVWMSMRAVSSRAGGCCGRREVQVCFCHSSPPVQCLPTVRVCCSGSCPR